MQPRAHSTQRRIALLVLLATAAVIVLPLFRSHPVLAPTPEVTDHSRTANPETAAQVARIEAVEQRMNETVWAKETLAQECGRTIEWWWDTLNVATNKLATAAAICHPIELLVPEWNPSVRLPHGIDLHTPTMNSVPLVADHWRERLKTFETTGWRLLQTEFRQVRFETDDAGQPRQSTFEFTAHLTNALAPSRATLEGPLTVDWSADRSAEGLVMVRRIDASQLTLTTRSGAPLLEPWLEESLTPLENAGSIDPLIVRDLDGDGRSEVILAAMNRIYRLGPDGQFVSAPICRQAPGLIRTALIADFDSDGSPDFLCLKHEGLFLFRGSAQGSFDEPGRPVWLAPAELQYPMAFTCGDIDGDGDLDLFLGQYKAPYEAGAMPTPFHDANDGLPAYLLRNDGRGGFTDVTQGSGLERKRHRRTYSASFADLDTDGKLDLLVVSDFAGVDLYRNDGQGRFEDVTARWVAEPKAFGMAHALSDFNRDGRLDLLVIGMHSPTVDRLEHLGLWRSDDRHLREMRARMVHGNRLLLARADAGYEQTTLNATLARSGWSWGCSVFDVDNDGWPDVYVANGMESRESVRDYESEFWLHDIYVGGSEDDPAAYLYFKAKLGRTQGRGYSYGGYEKNRLFLNQEGGSFREIGHLAGVAIEEDSRCVVGDDLDGDGRVDLLVTSYEVWPRPRQMLRIFRNSVAHPGNWIGLRLLERVGRSLMGARITVAWAGGKAVRTLVTGDSHRSQHGTTVHFGLGKFEAVESAEIRWPSGQTTVLQKPAVNRYHLVEQPAGPP